MVEPRSLFPRKELAGTGDVDFLSEDSCGGVISSAIMPVGILGLSGRSRSRGFSAHHPLYPGGVYAVASQLSRHPGGCRTAGRAGDSPGKGRSPRRSAILLARLAGVTGVVDCRELDPASQ